MRMYFAQPGPENTEATVAAAIQTTRERGIKYIVVASNEGVTAERFVDCGAQVVCVTHPNGFREPGHQEMSPEKRHELQSKGVSVYTGSLLFGGAERGVNRRFQGAYPASIIANTLKMLGQGTKVAVEIAVMALDAGLIPYGEDVIAVAGTKRGADTAIIVRPAHASYIMDTWVSEIICKPR
jgi:hypothetical protein